MRKASGIWALAAGLFLLCSCAHAAPEETIRLGATSVDRAARTMAVRVLEHAYQRAGIPMEIAYYPPKRRMALVHSGAVDGLTGAAERSMLSTSDNIDDLIEIPVPIAYEEIMVFSNGPDFTVSGYENLKPYRVGFVLGINFLRARLQGLNTDSANDSEVLIRKLAAGRTDVAVDLRSTYCIVRRLGSVDVRMLQPPLETQYYYHYLHKHQEEVAQKISRELARMREDGSMRAIQAAAVREFEAACALPGSHKTLPKGGPARPLPW